MRRLFVFRPEAAACQTIVRARELGLNPVPVPLFELEALEWPPQDPADFDALLLTSANTVRMAGPSLELYRGLPVHAVGEGTAVAARDAGLRVATVGSGGIDSLLAELHPELRLLHLCGEDKREPAVEGRSINSVAIYRAKEKANVSGLEGLGGQVGVVHSPRAARRLAQLVEPASRGDIRIAAISAATGEAGGEGWEDVRIASAPNDKDLLSLCVALCET